MWFFSKNKKFFFSIYILPRDGPSARHCAVFLPDIRSDSHSNTCHPASTIIKISRPALPALKHQIIFFFLFNLLWIKRLEQVTPEI